MLAFVRLDAERNTGDATRVLEAAIRELPDGTYRSELKTDGIMETPITIRMSLTIKGDEIEMDFAGTDAQVDRAAQQSLAAMGLGDAPRFSVPMPFNTLLWRVVVMTPDGFLEGERSLVADRGPMRFRGHPSNVQALRQGHGAGNVRFRREVVEDALLVLAEGGAGHGRRRHELLDGVGLYHRLSCLVFARSVLLAPGKQGYNS